MKPDTPQYYRFGPKFIDDEHVQFRLWAPSIDAVHVKVGDREYPMAAAEDGWFHSEVHRAPDGTTYQFVMPDGLHVPDPASRQQADDVHGASIVRRPPPPTEITRAHVPWESSVIYETHVGTATPEGTFTALISELPVLRDCGITVLELLPVADFPGAWNWGYDGVLPFAPDRRYGTPDELRALVSAAHRLGMAVWMDVVYNHFGPEGNYLYVYARDFFSEAIETPWGAGIDFSVPQVRQFFVENACYWTAEFGIDGLRVDAVHAIEDESTPHFITELVQTVKRSATAPVAVVLENERNESRYLRGADDTAADAQWNDDLHHALHVLVTGQTTGYYGAYAAQPEQMLMRALREGFIYQGEPSPTHGGAARGEPSGDLSPLRFISFLQNHDQIGNRAFGERITTLAPAAAVEAALAVVLLAPQVPMLFMGELWLSQTPFQFFCDFAPDLAKNVREGRRREFGLDDLPDPTAAATRDVSRPGVHRAQHSDGEPSVVPELLRIRHTELVPMLSSITRASAHGGGEEAVTVAWEAETVRWVMVLNLTDGARPISAVLPLPETPPLWPAATGTAVTDAATTDTTATDATANITNAEPWSVRVWKEVL